MGVPQGLPTQFSRVLQQSAETRMRAIQEKISLASTFCTSVDLEIRYGNFDRAKERLCKLHSALNNLTVHINDPAHVADKTIKQKFGEQLAQLRQRVSLLNSQLESPQTGRNHNS